jgi:16S rRNA (cytosine967-C5)-methyltransferase
VTGSRRVALDALVRIESGAFSHILVPQLLSRSELAPRDRAAVTAFVYGAVRMQRVLDDALARVSNRPLAELDAPVRAVLRLGAFQLFDGVAAHAAVGETVDAAPARVRPFVNGVLRSLARQAPCAWPSVDAQTPERELGVRLSHPDWMVERFVHDFGRADAVAMMQTNNAPPPVTLRPNRLRTTTDALLAELRDAGTAATTGELVPSAVVLGHARDPGALAAVREGRATPQDQASQAVVAAFDPQAGERVLDAAAAPGGKATASAERMGDDGTVVASDVHAGRVHLITSAASRLRLHAVQCVVADGRAAPFAASSFDRVLLDAPCSGLGVLRRRPEARWRVEPSDIEQLAALQRALLASAARLVRPGGRLVYSVCTVSSEETREVDAWARGSLDAFVALDVLSGTPWRPHGRGALVLPHDAGSDGMFVLTLQRAG